LKKLLLVYNPASGSGIFHESLDDCVEVFQQHGYFVNVLRTSLEYDTAVKVGELLSKAAELPDLIVVAGGDGTLNRVINALMKSGNDIPVGILSAGTANDFARFLGSPANIRDACHAIGKCEITKIDVGLINGEQYFINVCAAGMFSNMSHHVDQEMKNSFGKLAYYMKGIEQIPSFAPLHFRITTSSEVIEEELYFFYILNSGGTGGFDKLAPLASLDDGLFDFIGFRAFPMLEFPALFMKVLSGDYIDDRRILFLRDSKFHIEYINPPDDKFLLRADTDGELGPQLPIEVQNKHKALSIVKL